MRKWLVFLLAILLMALYARLDQVRQEQEWLQAADQLFRP
jgi:type II secretory pathway component PulJ